ncbi:hypothetical protein [Methylobacterium sp. 285MFTsu5.1]|uniref:hypothetical protein n=1 Tax=Methylobacterium sp. 285MFTsu5.1 TaxID=1172187 RepID=UPI001319F20B|nr:hypothetical protein [Methylobacterium sp. 285MFTsu5.1]
MIAGPAMLYVKDKDLQPQYVKLQHFNPALCSIVQKLADYVSSSFNKDVIVTCIYRSQSENDSIYKNVTKKKKITAHGVWAAIDIRSHGLEDNIPDMLKFLNAYNSTNANKTKSGQTAIFHEIVGHGPHFHIQYQKKEVHAHFKNGHGDGSKKSSGK